MNAECRKKSGEDQPRSESDVLLWSVDQVARALSISRRSVWRLVSTGELPPAMKIPGIRGARWRRADVCRFVEGLR